MNTAEIASALVEFCRDRDYAGAHDALFADDAVSVEPDSTPETILKGREALARKAKQFEETMEIHDTTVSDPLVAGPFFSCVITADMTDRKSGARFKMEEIGVYEVRNGRIVKEQFFYPAQA